MSIAIDVYTVDVRDYQTKEEYARALSESTAKLMEMFGDSSVKEKHLPGRHDQKRHDPHKGRKWDKGYGKVPDMAEAEALAEIPGWWEGDLFEKNLLDEDLDAIAGYYQQIHDKLGVPEEESVSPQIPEIRSSTKNKVVSDLSEATGLPYDRVNELIATWADTANDENPTSLGLQHAASELFGVQLTDFQKVKIDLVTGPVETGNRSFSEEARLTARWAKNKFEFEAAKRDGEKVLQAMYEDTQRQLAKAGIKEVSLFRGVSGHQVIDSERGDMHRLEPNALESWSLKYYVGETFAIMQSDNRKQPGVVYKMRVPAERVVSMPTSGIGCLPEFEYIVMGTPGDGGYDEAVVVRYVTGYYSTKEG